MGDAIGGHPTSSRITRELVQHLVQSVASREGAQVRVESADETRRNLVLGRAHGDPGRERRDRLVADVLIDELRRAPERVDVDPGVDPEARRARSPALRQRCGGQ